MSQVLNKRKKLILKKVVEEYIKKAKPISSGILAKKDFPKLSSATLRNEMLDLTRIGLLFQPHTSAGKVPTENAFKFFLDNFLEKKELNTTEKNIFLKIKNNYQDERKKIKELAKELAQQAKEAIIVAFSKDDYFYTGLSYLFSQPEFQDLSFIYSISEVIDHLDETMKNIFDKIEEIKILLGEENPFGNKCSIILAPLKKSKQKIVIGLLGPIRMDYSKNLSLIKFIETL